MFPWEELVLRKPVSEGWGSVRRPHNCRGEEPGHRPRSAWLCRHCVTARCCSTSSETSHFQLYGLVIFHDWLWETPNYPVIPGEKAELLRCLSKQLLSLKEFARGWEREAVHITKHTKMDCSASSTVVDDLAPLIRQASPRTSFCIGTMET